MGNKSYATMQEMLVAMTAWLACRHVRVLHTIDDETVYQVQDSCPFMKLKKEAHHEFVRC